MGTRRSRHNRGRKPMYKEHRDTFVELGDGTAVPEPEEIEPESEEVEEEDDPTGLLPDAVGFALSSPGVKRRLTYKQLLERKANDIQPIGMTAEQILSRERYMGGLLLNRGLDWMESDLSRLKVLCAASADLDRGEIALGRPKKALAWRARDMGLSLPASWRGLVTPRSKGISTPLLQFPFIMRSTPKTADLERANALVPRGFNPDMRADICQSVMLALYEGTVTLEELEKNKDRMRYFVAKFYKDQRPFQEITGFGGQEDERPYYEIAAEPYAVWRTDEISEHRRAHDAWKDHTPAEQEDAIYNQEIAHMTFLADRKGLHLETADVRLLVDTGEWDGEAAPYASSPTKYHVISRAKERYGLDVTDAHIEQLAKFCRYNRPARVHPYSEVHEFKRGDFRMAVVYSRKRNAVLTVLPLEELDG